MRTTSRLEAWCLPGQNPVERVGIISQGIDERRVSVFWGNTLDHCRCVFVPHSHLCLVICLFDQQLGDWTFVCSWITLRVWNLVSFGLASMPVEGNSCSHTCPGKCFVLLSKPTNNWLMCPYRNTHFLYTPKMFVRWYKNVTWCTQMCVRAAILCPPSMWSQMCLHLFFFVKGLDLWCTTFPNKLFLWV